MERGQPGIRVQVAVRVPHHPDAKPEDRVQGGGYAPAQVYHHNAVLVSLGVEG